MTGGFFEAYTEVNSAEHTLSTASPAAPGAYDLQTILTHEAGHFFGLAHSTDPGALMYAFYQPGAIRLGPDDVDAICTVYPAPQASGGCSCAMPGHRSGTAAGLAGASCVVFVALRRRRRRSGARGGLGAGPGDTSRASASAAALTLAVLVSSCSGNGSSGSGCVPPAESCDRGSPEMMPLEASGCLGAPTKLTQVCVTSANRCYPSAGLGVVCAFAPDGTVYAMVGSDNDVLTAPGWRFSQYVVGATAPSDQVATPEETTTCQRLWCASPCPGLHASYLPFACPADSGVPDGSDAGG